MRLRKTTLDAIDFPHEGLWSAPTQVVYQLG